MTGPEPGSRIDSLWWAVPRLVGFGGLFMVFAVGLGALYAVLPLPRSDSVALLGAAVTAAAAIGAGAILIRFADGRSPAALGIGLSRETARHVLVGVGIGAAALVAAVAGMAVAGSLQYASQEGTAGAWLLVVGTQGAAFTAAAFAEEALFRGYGFQVLVRAAGAVPATIATAVLFAAAHAGNPEVGGLALLNIFLAGIMLAVAYLRTLSLWFATAVHVGWNWAMATLFDLPVSGIAIFDTPFYQPSVGGPDWWTGGAFGPEGGLVGTIGFAVATLAVLRLRMIRHDPAVAAARPLVAHERGEG